MEPENVAVQGEVMKWARKQQGLTQDEVATRGGPSKGYQSELENGKKRSIKPDMLAQWRRALGVSPELAQGLVPRFHTDPDRCCGYAAVVGRQVQAAWDAGQWQGPMGADTSRYLLERVCARVGRLDLAHMLHLDVLSLTAIIEGTVPMPQAVIEAISVLTTLPVDFVMGIAPPGADAAELGAFQTAVRMAIQKGLTPEQLEELVRRADPR